jgi:hypothetical protein
MANCAVCGMGLPESSRFCNGCGAAQEAPTETAEAVGEPTDDMHHASAVSDPLSAEVPATRVNRHRTLGIALAVVVVLLAGGGGVAWKMTADRAAAQAAAEAKAAAASAAKRVAMDKARSDASSVLTAVGECESAVKVGVALDNLSAMATTAEQEVEAFKRTDSATLMPDFTAAIAAAALAYTDSCRAWFEDDKIARKKYDAAVHQWIYHNKGIDPQFESFRNDTKYQALWSEASTQMLLAQSAFDQEVKAP